MTTTDSDLGVMQPASLDGVDGAFELRLINAIKPISEHFLAMNLYHFFDTGIYDQLAILGRPEPITDLAHRLELDLVRLRSFLVYLANEGVVIVHDDIVSLTQRAESSAEFRSWYTFLIGGYAPTVAGIGDALRAGAPPCPRNGAKVGVGSCEIARYDGIPMLVSLLQNAGITPHVVLDLGCGNGLYLVEVCRQFPHITAWGIEPDPAGFGEAQRLIKNENLDERVRLINTSAERFLADPPTECLPDLVVFGYVLQEILGQRDEDSVVQQLRSVVTSFPQIDIAVIEVADESANPTVMRHQLARRFWNAYYLIHPFTRQRLESRVFWENLFRTAGLACRETVTTPAAVDSTGVELGYLLRGQERASSVLLGGRL
jgi:2-ketoarginine methyltransferase